MVGKLQSMGFSACSPWVILEIVSQKGLWRSNLGQIHSMQAADPYELEGKENKQGKKKIRTYFGKAKINTQGR